MRGAARPQRGAASGPRQLAVSLISWFRSDHDPRGVRAGIRDTCFSYLKPNLDLPCVNPKLLRELCADRKTEDAREGKRSGREH